MRSIEPIETENKEVATMFEAQRCRELETSSLAEVLQMLRGTVWYVKMESLEARTVMIWAVCNESAEAG